jgi:hypothetical protein
MAGCRGPSQSQRRHWHVMTDFQVTGPRTRTSKHSSPRRPRRETLRVRASDSLRAPWHCPTLGLQCPRPQATVLTVLELYAGSDDRGTDAPAAVVVPGGANLPTRKRSAPGFLGHEIARLGSQRTRQLSRLMAATPLL